jgi:hypothetical protein
MITPSDAGQMAEQILRDCGRDTERLHARLDDLLCEVLRQNGYHRLVYLFEHTEKWCA